MQVSLFLMVVLDKAKNSLVKQKKLRFLLQQYQIRIMKQVKSQIEQAYETSDSQNNHFQHTSSLFKYSLELNNSLFNKYFSLYGYQYTTPTIQNIHNFTQRTSQNIVLQSTQAMVSSGGKRSIIEKNKKSAEMKKKVKRIPVQKESRNVLSNILRIFFKCMLQNKMYDCLIQKIAQRYNLTVNKQQFYRWVLNFNINFKNYIQQSQMKRLFSPSNSVSYKTILMTVLQHYLNNYAISHCLTSKKIEHGSIKMHLLGLKDIQAKVKEFNAVK